MQCIELTGSDDRMDCGTPSYNGYESVDNPLNRLPPNCPMCNFPDIDHVSNPYQLVKSRTLSPNEIAPAEQGNLLVRHRIRQIMELLAPGQLEFHPTCFKGTSENTPWTLAVPTNQVITATVDPRIPRCDQCGEPRSAHPGSQYSEWVWNHQSEYDVLKSATWGSSDKAWNAWMSRDIFMSVRLFHLLKTINAKGLDQATCGKPTQPDKDDLQWIRENLVFLKQAGIPLHAPGTVSDADAKWLRGFIKFRENNSLAPLDIKSIERHLKVKLPKSYVDFITKVGPFKFERIDEQQSFNVRILTPDTMDSKLYRIGVIQAEDEESNAVDGLMFASTDHGDCFCFDVQKDKKEFEVFLYKHEYNCFEPFAENFASCIKRFACSQSET